MHWGQPWTTPECGAHPLATRLKCAGIPQPRSAAGLTCSPRSSEIRRRIAGTVRDPLEMVVSAYCYHHRGKEAVGNMMFWPPGSVAALGPKKGVAFVAERMTQLVENMTSAFEFPRNDTHRVSYERITRSSEDFDKQVKGLLKFWFDGLISPEEHQRALEAARLVDMHRHPEAAPEDHANDAECMDQARKAVFAIPIQLLARYRAFQRDRKSVV